MTEYNNNNNKSYITRIASHAGTWYDNDPKRLSCELDNYFKLVKSTIKANKSTKAIISPHAGYRYSGRVAASAYNTISNNINRVFILGPSHHRYLDNCALPSSNIKEYDTPFGTLPLDEEVLGELRGLSKTSDSEFGTIFTKAEDEDEHSIEMQLPLIYHQLKHRQGVNNVTIVPIIVGVLSANVERVIGRLLAKYFKEEGTLFVISSDFCHWGLRFRYTQLQTDKDTFPDGMVFNGDNEAINAGIEAMDREGMALIANQDFDGFKRYLQTTGNTICGRHPISVLLETLRNVNKQYNILFNDYNHSTLLPLKPSRNDSCVAYAAGVIQKEDNNND